MWGGSGRDGPVLTQISYLVDKKSFSNHNQDLHRQKSVIENAV